MDTQGPVNLKAEYRNDHREEESKGTHDHRSSQGLVHKHLNTLNLIYFVNEVTFDEESSMRCKSRQVKCKPGVPDTPEQAGENQR